LADFTIRDNNTKIRITCLKRDGAFFNLTGHTVQMRFRIRNIEHPPVPMTIIDAVGGVVEYTFGLGSGIIIVAGVNDRLDIDLDVTSPPAGAEAYTIPPATYPTLQDVADVLDPIFKAAYFFSECTVVLGKLRVASPGFPITTYFGTGPNLARSAAVTLGFLPVDTDLGLDEHIAEGAPVIALADDLAQEGIMYVEFEITETSSGAIVSSSEITTFVVRGKVTS
jgi:hypothetical protein